jgi:hypothetical protein
MYPIHGAAFLLSGTMVGESYIFSSASRKELVRYPKTNEYI